jgi:dTDP-4-amino-4,6-dideoxygalactose transaminase
VKHAISVASCTAGLHLGLFAHDIKTGDEVIVPAMTHVATAHVVELCGAKPVFVDVGETDGNINPAFIASALSERTKAAMVVHFLGMPCDMKAIHGTLKGKDITVIEDCAIALDATYFGAKTGTLGTLGAFSFYPIKQITSIEGGMVTTNDDALAASIRMRKAFGYDRTVEQRTKPGVYDVVALGFNYRMSEVEAAVGLAQLRKLDGFLKKRQENYNALSEALKAIDEVTVFADVKGAAKSSHYCLNAILPRDGSVSRDTVVDYLKNAGVGTSVHYPNAVPLYTYYREKYGYRVGQFPVAEWLAAQTISLPCAPHVTPDDMRWVAEKMKEAVRAGRK